MSRAAPTIYLSDYKPYPFVVDKVELTFALDAQRTLVTTKLTMRARTKHQHDLLLDGHNLELCWIRLNNRVLESHQYHLESKQLCIPATNLDGAQVFTIEHQVAINPAANFALEGLYQSKNMLCTQCEAQGFRRITFYPDRPDVMSRFTVRIQGSITHFPVMLSNGNRVSQDTQNGIQTVIWEDPFPKPAYLFALVAGQLEQVVDSFTTVSGRKVALHMYVEEHNLNKCRHALNILKCAMRWDEQTYGLEYDLDLFQIVATDDFNSGAMENKGLNIFNSECVLAHPDTNSDDDYLAIEAIVAHEYFHNWSGNRVTLRDWFQLSLKEGFTVFRENQFIASVHSAKIKRIEEAQTICTAQFAEDASPTRHPVRPNSYQQIRNFYTLTVYEKGAEVIRTLETLIGAESFNKGARLYFERHDGQAACVEDFVACMEEASGKNLTQFMRWYTQAGTPLVEVSLEYNAHTQCCHLTFTQSIKHEPAAEPLHIPIAIKLFSSTGAALGQEHILKLTQRTQRFTFDHITEPPVPSLLRDFSAPVDLSFPYDHNQLYTLFTHESDGYIRWKSAQSIKAQALLGAMKQWPNPGQNESSQLEHFFRILFEELRQQSHPSSDAIALYSQLLRLPSFQYLAEQQSKLAVAATWHCRAYAEVQIGLTFADQWRDLASRFFPPKRFSASFNAIVTRRMYLLCLTFIEAGNETLDESTWERYIKANNMTEREQALETLVWHRDSRFRAKGLNHFYDKVQQNSALAGRWFELQASIPEVDTLQRVIQLTDHPLFDWHNPNKLRSLLGCFTRNPIAFHQPDSYAFYADTLLRIDGYNSQVAARLATPFFRWQKLESGYASSLRYQLERLHQHNISSDLREGIDKSLAST